MRRTPLDATTMALAQAAVSASRRFGRDPIEELHRQGLILSPDVRVELQHQVLQQLLDILYHTRPAEMWRRNKTGTETPRVMFDIMIEFIEEYKATIGRMNGEHHP